MQQKEIKQTENLYKEKYFYIKEETLLRFNQRYNIKELSDYINTYLNGQSLKNPFDRNKMIKEVEKFCDIEQKQNYNKNGQHTDYIHHGIEYYKSNNIKYPNNFSLIESQFYYIFNEISGKKMNEIQGATEQAKKGI